MLWIVIIGVGILFVTGVRYIDRKVSREVHAELKLRGVEPPVSAQDEQSSEVEDTDFADEIPSDILTLTIGDKSPVKLKAGEDLRAIVDGLGMGDFVVLSRGHFYFIQAIHEADGFLMEMREGRDHLQAEWQPRYGDRSPYFDNDVVAETLSAYVEKRPMLDEIIWEPIAE